MNEPSFGTLSEIELQALVRTYLTDVPEHCNMSDGTPLQVLSIGEWNHGAGPDFLNVALLAGGSVCVGNAEFHRKTSDWEHHDHSNDAAYSNLLLHIVLRNDRVETFGTFTIALEEAALRAVWERQRGVQTPVRNFGSNLAALNLPPTDTLAVLHEYALRRMERKTAYSAVLLEEYGLESALQRLVQDFAVRRAAHKRRPRGIATLENPDDARTTYLQTIIQTCLAQSSAENLATHLATILTNRASSTTFGGKGTRTELFVNVLAPLLLASWTDERHKQYYAALIDFLQSLRRANVYAALQRTFPHVPQETVWQQQGLLEYYAEVYVPAHEHAHARACTRTRSGANAPSQNASGVPPIRPHAAHASVEYVLTMYRGSF
jgi:Protein of unknown function (DUF2851)